MVSDFEYKDEGEYQVEQKYSIKEIVLRQIKKIGDICCNELRGGWWEKKPVHTKTGIFFVEVYHDDLREGYCNAIDFLIDVVYPMSDEKFREYVDENEKIDNKIDIKEKVLLKRKTFREINVMFERINFWQSSDAYDE